MRLIGLDIGSVRIGIAVSDPNNRMALPLEVLDRQSDETAVDHILRLADEYEADAIVYGDPLTLGGDSGGQARETSDFIKTLRRRTELDLIAVDERMTTREAERILIARGVKRSGRRKIVDKIAASIILQKYLDKENYGKD